MANASPSGQIITSTLGLPQKKPIAHRCYVWLMDPIHLDATTSRGDVHWGRWHTRYISFAVTTTTLIFLFLAYPFGERSSFMKNTENCYFACFS
jgi:hypothetical protein